MVFLRTLSNPNIQPGLRTTGFRFWYLFIYNFPVLSQSFWSFRFLMCCSARGHCSLIEIPLCLLKISLISLLPFSQEHVTNLFIKQITIESLWSLDIVVGIRNSTRSEQNTHDLCPFGSTDWFTLSKWIDISSQPVIVTIHIMVSYDKKKDRLLGELTTGA